MGGHISEEQRKILADIDAILTMAEERPDNRMDIRLEANPFNFLFGIILKFVKLEDMIKWLANMLTVILPAAELALKGVLLLKLKERIDCNNDPRIPNWLRKNPKNPNCGLKFHIGSIDFTNMLNVSPFSDYGNYMYFGVGKYYIINNLLADTEKKYKTYDEAFYECNKLDLPYKYIEEHSILSNAYELARADDFNAFLWFVIHKGYFNLMNLKDLTNKFNILGDEKNYAMANRGEIIPGDAFHKEDSSLYSLCIKVEGNNNAPQTNVPIREEAASEPLTLDNLNAVIVPVSDDNVSANWYADSGSYYNFLKPLDKRKPRNYYDEFPICNLQYLDRVDGNTEEGGNYTYYGGLKFTIPPKPFTHIPHDGEPIWRFKRFLFDNHGIANKKGRYSVKINLATKPITLKTPIDGKERIYAYKYPTMDSNYNVIISAETGKYELLKGEVPVTDNDDLSKVLYECYPGITVYEFNYDFVMSMKFFDPVSVASKLIAQITNIKIGGVNPSIHISKTETAYQMRISEIVKNIVEATAYESSDCFYTFNNDKYDSMLRNAELKRSQQYPFNKNGKIDMSPSNGDEALKILNEFDDNATLNKNVDVITRAFTQATASITEEVLPEDKYDIEFSIIEEIIKSLTCNIIESLFTPKLMLLLEVNTILLGKRELTTDSFKYDFEEILAACNDLIVGLVKELRDLILAQFLEWAKQLLMEMLNILKDELIKEQLEYYSRLMKLLLKACNLKKHRRKLDSELDNVDYADIDEIDRPIETNC